MTMWQSTAEGGSNGIGVTVANSATSGDAFSVVNTASGGTAQYSTDAAAFGTQSYKFYAPATNGIALARWTQTDSTLRLRCYVRFPAFPTGTVVFAQARANTSNTGADLRVTSTGALYVAASGLSQSLCTIALNTWYMVSLLVTTAPATNDGTIQAAVFDATGTTQLGAYTTTTAATGSETFTYAQVGKLTAGNPELTLYVDQLAMDTGAGSLIGPYSGAPSLTLTQQTYHVVDATASNGGTGSLTYSATWLSGPTLTVTQPQSGLFYFSQSATATSAYTITVSDANSAVDTQDITVPLASATTVTVNRSAPLTPGAAAPNTTWV